jgi:MFS family permease
MSAIPPSVRKILDSGRGEVTQLQRQYHIWLITTIIAFSAGILLIGVSIILFLVDKEDSLIIVRILVGVAAGADFIVSYVVFQETLARRRYLLEVQRLMVSGLSFLDSVRRGLRDLFGQ